MGDILIAGSEGRVRAFINDRGEQVKEAPPSMPVEVLGFQATLEAGDRFSVVENETRAREIADYRQRLKREKNFRPSGRGSLEAMMRQMKESGRKEFPLVIKADVQACSKRSSAPSTSWAPRKWPPACCTPASVPSPSPT